MPTYEGLRLKINKMVRKIFAKYRNKKINNKEFTIISNNCWGGMIYESYGLQKQSPTIGLYFMAEDYIKFIKNIKANVQKDIKFISLEESKWKDYIRKNDSKAGTYPIGKIDDIEIFFLHYKNEEEVKTKWKRRCQRINWEKILFKFNDQNNCTQKDLDEFIKLEQKNKIFFTVKEWKNKNDDCIKIKQFGKKENIYASYEPFGNNRYVNINKIINNL